MDRRDLVRGAMQVLPRPTRKRITKRLVPWLKGQGPYVADCRGVKLELDFREISSYRYFACGETARQIVRVLGPLLRPGGSFFDVGANQGFFALLAGLAVGRGGRVVAFEPDPKNHAGIQRNLALNRLPQVVVEQAAVSDRDGEASFHLGRQDEVGSLMLDPRHVKEQSLSVRTVSLDRYLEEHGFEHVDVVKMDIEGAEVLAFQGMREGLEKGRYRHIILEWHADKLDELTERRTAGFQPILDAGYAVRFIRKRPRLGSRTLLEPFLPEHLERRVHLLCTAPA